MSNARYPGASKLARGACTILLSSLLCLSAHAAEMLPPSGPPGEETRPYSPHYLIASQVDWISILPAPPKAGSPEQQRDLQAVLDMQATTRQTPARRQQAIDDSEHSCFRYADILGSGFDEKKLTHTAELLKNATEDGARASGIVKLYWKRPRPFLTSDQIEKLGDMNPEYVKQKAAERKAKQEQEQKNQDGKDAKPKQPKRKTAKELAAEKQKVEEMQKENENTSYPSGHATFGTLCGILLSQMLPEKQAEIFTRASVYRESRMINGAHFRTDIEAGESLATAVAAVMSQNHAFQHDLGEARVELRTALGLPAELPVRASDKPKQASKGKK